MSPDKIRAEGLRRTTVKTTKVRIGAMLVAVLVAGGTIAGAVATQGGGDAGAGGRAVERETVQDAGEPIVYAGSYGLYPSK
jgi:hypothetical protein